MIDRDTVSLLYVFLHIDVEYIQKQNEKAIAEVMCSLLL
jgi:hypothetical protein